MKRKYARQWRKLKIQQVVNQDRRLRWFKVGKFDPTSSNVNRRLEAPSVCRRWLRSVTDKDEKHNKNNKIRPVFSWLSCKNNGVFLSRIAKNRPGQRIRQVPRCPRGRYLLSLSVTIDATTMNIQQEPNTWHSLDKDFEIHTFFSPIPSL